MKGVTQFSTDKAEYQEKFSWVPLALRHYRITVEVRKQTKRRKQIKENSTSYIQAQAELKLGQSSGEDAKWCSKMTNEQDSPDGLDPRCPG